MIRLVHTGRVAVFADYERRFSHQKQHTEICRHQSQILRTTSTLNQISLMNLLQAWCWWYSIQYT